MATPDFTTAILVDQTPEEVFSAINNVRGWWSEEIEGSTDKLDREFMYNYEDVHRCKIKIIEFIPNEKVVWLVLENYFKFTKDKSEWKGTKIIFEICTQGGKTKIQFTHLGLVPEYECYDICFNAWLRFGVGAMIFVFLAVTPYHDIVITISSTLALISIFYITVFVFKSKLHFFKVFCVVCLLVLYCCNYIYYTRSYLEFLPIMQKVAFAITMIWILGLEYFTKREDFQHIKIAKTNRGEEATNR